MENINKMRVVFMGTPEFAASSLKYLIDAEVNVVGVVTAADKKAGRGQKVRSSAVKDYAQKQGLKILQPTNLKSQTFVEELKALHADLQIVVAFRMLPEVVWNMPPMGTINLHASLLPNYRGAAPINWAIINREMATGLTTFFLKHQIDTGDILLQEEVEIAKGETAASLHDKLMHKGGPLLLKSLALIQKGTYELKKQKQDDSKLKAAPKIFPKDCQINWNKTNEEIDAFIRGLNPYPAAWTLLADKNDKQKRLKIFNICQHDNNSIKTAGKMLIENNKLFITTSNGLIEVLSLQLEGKKRMKTKDLLNGFPLSAYKLVLK